MYYMLYAVRTHTGIGKLCDLPNIYRVNNMLAWVEYVAYIFIHNFIISKKHNKLYCCQKSTEYRDNIEKWIHIL